MQDRPNREDVHLNHVLHPLEAARVSALQPVLGDLRHHLIGQETTRKNRRKKQQQSVHRYCCMEYRCFYTESHLSRGEEVPSLISSPDDDDFSFKKPPRNSGNKAKLTAHARKTKATKIKRQRRQHFLLVSRSRAISV